MCNFFSVVSNPTNGDILYSNWAVRKDFLDKKIPDMESPDSHTSIAAYHGYKSKDHDKLNMYEYNPLTKKFVVDKLNGEDDSASVEKWCKELDFKKIVPLLIVKPIIQPFEITPPTEVTEKHLELLKEWDSVRDSVGDSVWASVWDSVGDSVRDSVGASVWDSVWASVGDSVRDSVRASVGASVRDSVWASVRASVGDSVWAYCSSFFTIKDFEKYRPLVALWEMGLVPSFDGKVWRLHGGKKGGIVWEGKVK